MAILVPPDVDALVSAIGVTLKKFETIKPQDFHARVESYYSWSDIAARTEKVYSYALQQNGVYSNNIGELFTFSAFKRKNNLTCRCALRVQETIIYTIIVDSSSVGLSPGHSLLWWPLWYCSLFICTQP